MRAVTRWKSHVRDRARPLPIASILSPTCDSLLPPILTLPPSALGKEALVGPRRSLPHKPHGWPGTFLCYTQLCPTRFWTYGSGLRRDPVRVLYLGDALRKLQGEAGK